MVFSWTVEEQFVFSVLIRGDASYFLRYFCSVIYLPCLLVHFPDSLRNGGHSDERVSHATALLAFNVDHSSPEKTKNVPSEHCQSRNLPTHTLDNNVSISMKLFLGRFDLLNALVFANGAESKCTP